MDYYNKYLKYKTKYLNLKYNNHQYGGGADDIAQILESLNNLNYKIIGTTPVEMIFILADETSQFAKEINGEIMTVITSDEMYIAAQDTLLQAHSANLLDKFSNLFKLVESPSHSLENWTNDLYKLLKKFIDRYIQLEIFIGKTDLDISIEFAKLFDNIKLMLTGLYAYDNVIDEYLLFNLLSIFFLDYEVEFTNYYTDFNKINYKDCIGIIVNTSIEKLCVFKHKTNLISYSYTSKSFFSIDNSTLNNNILYIHDGKLIDEITYDQDLREAQKAECSKVMYITVITKSTNPNTNFGQILMTMKKSLDTILLITNDQEPQTDLKNQATALQTLNLTLTSITDKVMQYMFGKINFTTPFTHNDKFISLVREAIMNKMKADNKSIYHDKFAPTLYILGKYLRSVNPKAPDILKYFVESANYEYGPSMYYLCNYKPTITDASRDKWCRMGHDESSASNMQINEQMRIKLFGTTILAKTAKAKADAAAAKAKAEADAAKAKADAEAAKAEAEAAAKIKAEADAVAAKIKAEADAADAAAKAKAEAEAAAKIKAEAEAATKIKAEADAAAAKIKAEADAAAGKIKAEADAAAAAAKAKAEAAKIEVAKAEAAKAEAAKAEAEAAKAEAAKAEAAKTAKALEQQTHDALEQERKKQSTNNICIPNPAGEYFSLSECNKKK
jgi:hypothetical protein